MWKTAQSTVRPLEIDETSSKAVVYVRKDITESVTTDDNEEEITVYTYQENTIPKADWETYKAVMENESQTTDLELAVCELYEMIAGGN